MVGLIRYAPAQTPPASGALLASGTAPSATETDSKSFTVPSGAKILLSLKNEISTRAAMPGDSVYLVSDFPVVENGAVVLPAGMYVKGYIDRVQRPGKVKGRAQLQMHFGSIIFPNGVEIALPGSLDKVPGSSGAQVKNSEGTVEQGSSAGHDAKQIAGTTLEGAGVGSMAGLGAGNTGMGTGIGASAGAAIGVLTTLLTRGNDIVFPPGTTVEMVLNRPLVIQQAQLAGMPSYTGIPTPVGSQQSPVVTRMPHN
jgi:type IV secretion system protein VirB10